jgi:hypothetical protein
MGQYEMVPWSFNDKVSRWSWYEVGRPGATTVFETTRVRVVE